MNKNIFKIKFNVQNSFITKQALRCRTEDGPSEEEMRKVARICMKKVGQNDTQNEIEETSSDESDEDTDTEYNKQNQSSKSNVRNNNGYNQYGQSNYQYNGRNGYSNDNDMNYYGSMRPNGMNVAGTYGSGQTVNQNGYQNWNNQNSHNSYPHQNNNYNNNSTNLNGNNVTKNNQTEHDQACLMHCFFHELRLVKRTFLNLKL